MVDQIHDKRTYGIPGATGSVGTITVGSTTTLPAGSKATVSNSGTKINAVLDFGIPKGDKGDTGAKGDKGDKGDTGAKGDKGDAGSYTAGGGIEINDNTINVRTWGTADANNGVCIAKRSDQNYICVRVDEGIRKVTKVTEPAYNAIALAVATASTLGGVKVGSGLNVTADGTLSASANIKFADEATAKALLGY